MDIVVIGGTGHIGSFLTPRLVRAGHNVTAVSRGLATPYTEDPAWADVRRLQADREAEDRDGTFPRRIAELDADVVIDLVCYTTDSARALVDAIRGRTGQLVHCGSIWRYGPSPSVPITEEHGESLPPRGEYGIAKAAIARMLAEETADGGLVTASIHPGHIVGPGWLPIGPLGNLDHPLWQRISAGEVIPVPGDGTQTLCHVHADDVAQLFERAVADPRAAAGQDLNAVAATALSVRGYLELAASWFGQEARRESVDWETFRAGMSAEHAEQSWEHLSRSQVMSIEKGRTLLGYAPRYTPEQAILESVRSLVDAGRLEVARPLVGPPGA